MPQVHQDLVRRRQEVDDTLTISSRHLHTSRLSAVLPGLRYSAENWTSPVAGATLIQCVIPDGIPQRAPNLCAVARFPLQLGHL